MILDAMSEGRKAQARKREIDLDHADVEELQERADAERESFRIEITGLGDVSVEALSFWERLFTKDCAARLHLWHPARGRVTVTFRHAEDVRAAIKYLSAALGERLVVNAVYDYGKQAY